MTIPLTTDPTGFFFRLGRLAKALRAVNTFQSDMADLVEDIAETLDTDRETAAIVVDALADSQASAGAFADALKSAAESLLINAVAADSPREALTVAASMPELVRQMRDASESVAACTVAGSAVAYSGNGGNGVLLVSTIRGDGKAQENLLAEVAEVYCDTDSFSGGATAGSEQFVYVGDYAAESTLHQDWPTAGSGVTTRFDAIDANLDNSGGQLLTNGSLEAWTGQLPDSFLVTAGTSTLQCGTLSFYAGTLSLKITGDGASNTAFKQLLGDSTGTLGLPSPQTPTAWSLWLRIAGTIPAAGTLTVSLVNSAGTIVNDEAGTPNVGTITLSAATTSWVNYGGFFRLPRAIPDPLYIQWRLSTAMTNTRVLYLDHLGLGEATLAYPGGPYLAIFSGSSTFAEADGWKLTTTNDRAGRSDLATFQTIVDRFYGMRSLGLLLPSSASPTVPDTLIPGAGSGGGGVFPWF